MRAVGAGLSLLLAACLASPPRAVYTNHWAVRLQGGPREAERLAARYGYLNLGQTPLEGSQTHPHQAELSSLSAVCFETDIH
uniref:Uncharacterized protein n=1 Tax=Sphaerodactylus townsendi TaxID=933632 RepID=A0ACB8E672_9SAUR